MINSNKNIRFDLLSISRQSPASITQKTHLILIIASGHYKMDRKQISCSQWHAEFLTFMLDMLRKERSIAGSYLHRFGWGDNLGWSKMIKGKHLLQPQPVTQNHPWVPALTIEHMMFLNDGLQLPQRLSWMKSQVLKQSGGCGGFWCWKILY